MAGSEHHDPNNRRKAFATRPALDQLGGSFFARNGGWESAYYDPQFGRSIRPARIV